MAHAFWNAGPGPARIQEIISPAGFERYFRDVDEVLAPGGPPDLARLRVIATRYGVTLHMERLDETMRTHGVRLWGGTSTWRDRFDKSASRGDGRGHGRVIE